jgi:EAL domain-containing protein (putative c-di-GMP-specific phosphodiesterase class I)
VGDLLKAADTAMYQAKTRGKNNYLFYHSDMLAAGMERLKLESDLRQALEREGELMLHYQPQVDCRNGDIIGAEALLRWHHPEQGPIPPNRFIPLAEEIGLIGELGYWTLREACHQLVRFDRAGVKLPKVAVNVSALQFNQALIGQVRQALKDSGLSPERLVLELTEGIAMDDTRDVIKGLYELKKLGVTLSIDDFGTGYSSLNYLSRFPLDDLKIDRSFVTSLEGGGAASGLVSAIIAMANSLNLELVAEGVETAEQHKFLQERGVNIIQGFLFSKPLPAEEFAQLLSPGYYMPQITDLRGHGLRALK